MTESTREDEQLLEAALDALSETDAAEVVDVEADAVIEDALDVDTIEEAEAAIVASEDEEEVADDPYAAFEAELRTLPGKWYVIHSYAGFERKVKHNIENRRTSMQLNDFIFQIEVPMEDVVEIKNGQRKMVTRVRIPGYVLVRMDLNEDSWSCIRHTPGVTGFVGNAHNPTPLRFKEAFDMLKPLIEVKDVATAKAIRYPLNHREGLCRFLDGGRIELDTNLVERAIKLSHEKYCSASIMLGQVVPITHDFEVREAD